MGLAEMAYTMLKSDLGFFSPDEDTSAYMRRLISAAVSAISAKNITLADDNVADAQLVSMYAAWLYRKRDAGTGLPDMIRYAINNRIVQEATKAHDL